MIIITEMYNLYFFLSATSFSPGNFSYQIPCVIHKTNKRISRVSSTRISNDFLRQFSPNILFDTLKEDKLAHVVSCGWIKSVVSCSILRRAPSEPTKFPKKPHPDPFLCLLWKKYSSRRFALFPRQTVEHSL